MMKHTITTITDGVRVVVQEYLSNTLLNELVKLEKQQGELHNQRIVLVFEAAPWPQAILERLGYSAHPDQPGHFSKQVHYQRSVRFSLTEKCNYHCFFCHEEGMDMQTRRHASSDAQLFRVLDQLAELDYQDFTFTGGEPLLNPSRLLACMDYMQKIGYCPDITIVTNGVAITDTLLNKLTRYPNRLRFNISLHSVDSIAYANIVQNMAKPQQPLRQEFEKVQANLHRLQQLGLPFKLNVVLLKDLNTSDSALSALFDFALAVGATSIKFLELMLTPDLGKLYPYFYRLQAVHDRLSPSLTLIDNNYRRSEYQYRDTDLRVELQQCTCSRGCNTCAVNRATNFTAELKAFPCFLKPENNHDLTQVDLKTALAEGDQMIERMSQHYGDHSPIIIHPSYSAESETFYYYEISAADLRWLEQQWQLPSHLRRTRQFEEHYHSISAGIPTEHDISVHKTSLNSYDHSHLDIQQIIQTNPEQPGAFTTRFLHQGESGQSPKATTELTLNWQIQYYEIPKAKNPQQTRPKTLTISTNLESGIHLLRSSQPLEPSFEQLPVSLQPLTRPAFEWVRYRQRIL